MSRMLRNQSIFTARVAFALFSSLLIFTAAVLAEAQTEPHPIEAAKAAIKSKNDDEALKLLSAFVRSNSTAPEAVEARFLLGQIQTRQRQVDEAFRTFSAVISSARGTEWAAKALEETAKLHETRRNRTGAQQSRDFLLRDYPESPTTLRVWSAIADRHYQNAQFKEALAIYDRLAPSLRGPAKQQFESAKAIVDSGGEPGRLLVAANDALKNNRRNLARNLYQLIAGQKANPAIVAEARVKYAWCLYSEGGPENLAEAEKIWSSIASQDPRSEWGGQSRWHLVQLHAGPKREWQKAVEMCAAIARDFPPGSFRHEQALYTRAWLLRTHKQWEQAHAAFEDLVRYYPAKASHPPILRYMEEVADGLSGSSQASNR